MTQTAEIDALQLLEKIIAANSPLSIAILLFSTIFWIAGMNLLIGYHHRRVGDIRHKLFSFPFNNFNRSEWVVFLCMLTIFFASTFTALSVNVK